MPLTTPTSIFPLGGWTRGLNRQVFELQLQPDETPDCLNVKFGLRGEFETRDGWTRADTGVETVAMRGWEYTPGSGSDRLIVVEEDGGVWGSANLTLAAETVELGAHSNRRQWPIEGVMLDDNFYLFSIRDNTWRFDGSTWLEITDSTLDESGTQATPEAPLAATAASHHNRIFAGNVIASGAAHRSRVQYSMTTADNSGDAGGNRWPALYWIDVDEDDGTEITKLLSHQSHLLVFKDHSIHVIGGEDPTSFTLYNVNADVGCSSPNSVASNEGDVFFFDRFKGVFVFDGASAQRIDGAIHDYLMGGMNLNKAWKACGFFSDSRYFLSVPWGSDTENTRTFVFDVRLGAWAEYDYGVYDHFWFNEAEYTVGNAITAGSNVGVYKHEQGDATDVAAAITWYLETIWFPPAQQQGMTRYRMRKTDLWVEADSGTFTVDMYVDGSEVAVWTHAITASTNRIQLPGYGALWETIKYKIRST